MNDSLMTNLYVRYHPKDIVCACIHITVRVLGISVPCDPVWYSSFKLKDEEIEKISSTILELYRTLPPSLDVLETKCSFVKRRMDIITNNFGEVLREKYKNLASDSLVCWPGDNLHYDKRARDSNSNQIPHMKTK